MTLLERVTGKELKNQFLSIARKFTAFQDHRTHSETKTSSLIFAMLSVLEKQKCGLLRNHKNKILPKINKSRFKHQPRILGF